MSTVSPALPLNTRQNRLSEIITVLLERKMEKNKRNVNKLL